MAAPNFIVSFDPGLREAGFAVFSGGLLARAVLIRNPEKVKRDGPAWYSMSQEVGRVFGQPTCFGTPTSWEKFAFVSEIPQVYREGQSANVDPADLTNLAGVVGAVIGALNPNEVHTYVPAKWKGQVPKDIHNKRILARLDAEERAILDAVKCPASLKHNVIDAVGIGLFHLGRIGGVMK
jgi:hypothetical protein